MSREEDNRTFEEILSAYRKGDEERHAEDFDEALEALASDGALEKWFEEDQAFDAEFRGALSGVEAPKPRAVEPEPARVTRLSFVKLAAAAAVAILLGGIAFQTMSHNRDVRAAALVADWRDSMAAFAAQGPPALDLMNNDLSILRELMTSKGGSTGGAMDSVFENGVPMGCKIVDWDGRKVTLYCFGNDQGQVVHCFVVPLDMVNGPAAAGHLKAIVEHAERDTGGFVVDDTAYLLVSSMPGVDIKPFLLPAQAAHLAALSGSSILSIALLPAP